MWLTWLECRPVSQKVAGSIPGQSTCLGCRFSPQWGLMQQATNWCFSFASIFFTLFLSPHSLLSEINKHVLGWRLKKKSPLIYLCISYCFYFFLENSSTNTQRKTDKLEITKIKNFCASNNIIKKVKGQPIDTRKFCKSCTIRHLYLEHTLQLHKKERNNPLKDGQRIWIDVSQKKTYKWTISTWKNTQHN